MATRKLLESKPSELLRRAVEDARIVSRRPGVTLNMNIFVAGTHKKCEVCLAGAVMLRMNASVALDWHGRDPSSFATRMGDWSLSAKLFSIEYMRRGNFFYSGYFDDKKFSRDTRRVVARAEKIVRSGFNVRLQRASWKTYLRAASLLRTVGL